MQLAQLDPLAIWKAIAVGLTGAFGVLGLLTNYRDKSTDRITRWGYVALMGMRIVGHSARLAPLAGLPDHACYWRDFTSDRGRRSRYVRSVPARGCRRTLAFPRSRTLTSAKGLEAADGSSGAGRS